MSEAADFDRPFLWLGRLVAKFILHCIIHCLINLQVTEYMCKILIIIFVILFLWHNLINYLLDETLFNKSGKLHLRHYLMK